MVSIVIASMDTIPDRTNKEVKTDKKQEALQMAIMKGSVNILNSHFRRDDLRKG